MKHAYRDPRLLGFEELAIIADLARCAAVYAKRRSERTQVLCEVIEEVAAGNAVMFPSIIADARKWLMEAGQELPSVELARLVKPHLVP